MRHAHLAVPARAWNRSPVTQNWRESNLGGLGVCLGEECLKGEISSENFNSGGGGISNFLFLEVHGVRVRVTRC